MGYNSSMLKYRQNRGTVIGS